jgi:hypothetical protein
MVVPATTDGFRAAGSALRYFEGKEGMTFHTSLPEDRCVRLLVKNLMRRMPESAVREESESLGIQVQGVMQLRSGRRDQNPWKDRHPTPHFIVSVTRGPEVSRVRSVTGLCGLRVSVESYVPPKGPLQCRRCQCFGHTEELWAQSPLRRVWRAAPLVTALSHGASLCCSCGGDRTASYQGCPKWKEARASLARRAPERGRRKNAASKPATPKERQAEPSVE